MTPPSALPPDASIPDTCPSLGTRLLTFFLPLILTFFLVVQSFISRFVCVLVGTKIFYSELGFGLFALMPTLACVYIIDRFFLRRILRPYRKRFSVLAAIVSMAGLLRLLLIYGIVMKIWSDYASGVNQIILIFFVSDTLLYIFYGIMTMRHEYMKLKK